MAEEQPKKKRGRRKKAQPLPPSIKISPKTGETIQTVMKSAPQLRKRILPHELFQTLESLLIRVENLENLIHKK